MFNQEPNFYHVLSSAWFVKGLGQDLSTSMVPVPTFSIVFLEESRSDSRPCSLEAFLPLIVAK